jgi:hypothetical protein
MEMKREALTIERKSDTRLELVTRRVTLEGRAPIMFDRYAGDNSTKLEWSQKMYLIEGTSDLCFPTLNIVSLLSAHNTNSAPKRLRDKRKYKDIANACLSFVQIDGEDDHPTDVRFTRHGIPITVGTCGEARDTKSGLFLHRASARLKDGVVNNKERPVLPLPWELTFTLKIFPNKEIKEQEIRNLIEEAGIAIGLGTWRGVFGKFAVTAWT